MYQLWLGIPQPTVPCISTVCHVCSTLHLLQKESSSMREEKATLICGIREHSRMPFIDDTDSAIGSYLQVLGGNQGKSNALYHFHQGRNNALYHFHQGNSNALYHFGSLFNFLHQELKARCPMPGTGVLLESLRLLQRALCMTQVI